MPLLHTWSLAVEEQFYLVWPLFLLGCAWAAGLRKWPITLVILAVLVTVSIASLAYSQFASEAGGRTARFAFFGLPSRAWELAIGAGLALALPYIKASGTWLGAALAGAGLLAIAVSVASFQEGMAFPGIAALLPTLGTAAVIAGGWLAPQSLVPRLLSTRVFVGVGLLSYGWYLWHWPLLAIARAHRLGAQDFWRDAAIAFAALGLAWITYVCVEQPIRSRKIWSNWGKAHILGISAAASLTLVAGAHGLWGYANQLSRSDRYQRLVWASNDKSWSKTHCHHKNGKCKQAAEVPYRGFVILWGDSHADHFEGMLHASVAPLGLALVSRHMGGCPPVAEAVVFAGARPLEECGSFNAKVLAEIDGASQRGELAAVVLSARWPLYLGRPKPSGEPSPRMLAPQGQPPSVETAAAVLYDGLNATVMELLRRGIRVVVIAPGPEHQYDIPQCLARKSMAWCSIGREDAENHRAPALAAVTSAVKNAPGARLWDPFPSLCDNVRCPAEDNGLILYHDAHHLTYSGSRFLAPYFQEMAAWLAGGLSVPRQGTLP